MVIGKQIPVKPQAFPRNPFSQDASTNGKGARSSGNSIQFQSTPRTTPRPRIELANPTAKRKGEGEKGYRRNIETIRQKKAKGNTTGTRTIGIAVIGEKEGGARGGKKNINNPDKYATKNLQIWTTLILPWLRKGKEKKPKSTKNTSHRADNGSGSASICLKRGEEMNFVFTLCC